MSNPYSSPESADRNRNSRVGLTAKALWFIVCVNLWGFAIFGSCLMIAGVWFELTDTWGSARLFGSAIDSHNQKEAWFVTSSVFALLGFAFIWLHITKRLRFDAEPHVNVER